jgi:hypothetical protein
VISFRPGRSAPGKEPPVPNGYEAVWMLWSRENLFPLPGINPGHPARCLSLYRLSYPGSFCLIVNHLKRWVGLPEGRPTHRKVSGRDDRAEINANIYPNICCNVRETLVYRHWFADYRGTRCELHAFFFSLGGVRLSPLCTSATVVLLYQPRMIDDYGAVGGMRIGRGNRSTRRKPAPVPPCRPQIPPDL